MLPTGSIPVVDRQVKMYIVHTERHKAHATDEVLVEGHPFDTSEVPARAELILAAAQRAQLGSLVTPSDHGLQPILAVHDADYVAFLRTAYDESASALNEAGPVFSWTFANRHAMRRPKSVLGLKGYYAFGWASPILKGTWEAAYWSAQCAVTAAALVRQGELVAYALCRPPGHHAAADLYGGYCYLNNAAIAARYLQHPCLNPSHTPERDSETLHGVITGDGTPIAILDVDYHHGNGTQILFYSDPTVLYCSLHAHPDEDYPYYWGDADERGTGPGKGTNRNWPLPKGTGDQAYLAALDQALAAIREFAPRYLVVSAGYDIVQGDPEGGFCITTQGLWEIGKRIAALALPTIIVQEGGYLLESLGENAVAFLQAFSSPVSISRTGPSEQSLKGGTGENEP
jgi:acetoin utilization deacetylase AcuC-like enzyme